MTKEVVSPNKKPFRPFQLRWNEPMGRDECPYARRFVLNTPIGSIRIHIWYRSDDKRAFHDHPYGFITIVLRGSYVDVTQDVVDHLRLFSIRYRKATHKHFVEVPSTGAATLLFCGRPHRKWGYYPEGRYRSPMKYFHKFGHPLCDEQ